MNNKLNQKNLIKKFLDQNHRLTKNNRECLKIEIGRFLKWFHFQIEDNEKKVVLNDFGSFEFRTKKNNYFNLNKKSKFSIIGTIIFNNSWRCKQRRKKELNK